jgi:formylglycine-generating enzyme required for sulfatase activity
MKIANYVEFNLLKGVSLKKLVLLLLPFYIFGKEYVFEGENSIDEVIYKTTSDITANVIDNSSISYGEAKNLFDEINMQFEDAKSIFQSRTLKLSIDASFLDRSIREKRNEIEATKSTIDRKNSKLAEIKSEIESEKRLIKELQNLSQRALNFNSNISTQGYFITFIENRRSVSRDNFVQSATETISTKAIQQLNGILVESIAKYSKDLSLQIRETSSGTAISDSSDTTLKLFFSLNRSTSVLIYGTKVDVYPFEKGEVIKDVSSKNSSEEKYFILIREKDDIEKVVKRIRETYPKLSFDKSIAEKIEKAISSIDEHNRNSREVLLKIEKSWQDFLKKSEKRISAREEIIAVLENHQKLIMNEIGELNLDLNRFESENQLLEDQFKLIQRDIIDVKKEVLFTKAEMYDRKHSNAINETKDIVRELLLDIDKSLLKTSKRMETIFNGSKILKDIVEQVQYEKFYIKSKIIPYFVDNTDKTGALVTLEIKFSDKKLLAEAKNSSIELVKIEAGNFKFGSEFGDSDELPVREMKIEKDFYIGKYEVTIGEYLNFAKDSGGNFPEWYFNKSGYENHCLDENCPVIGISWNDAVKYTEWLSKRDGKKYRLPTEKEWEFVAKADLNLDYGYLYGSLEEHSWFNENSEGKTHRVGTKKPNLLGVYDMHGNVWELCLDSYHYDYLRKDDDIFKVMRGGDWRTTKYYLRSSNRAKYLQNRKSNGVGFRVVQEIEL